MSWEKLKPLKKGQSNNCGTFHIQYGVVADMNMTIAVGFGSAKVTKDNKTIYDENDFDDWDDMWTVQDAENEALKNPDYDWRIIIHAPMHGQIYQRQGVGLWVMVDKNIGFA